MPAKKKQQKNAFYYFMVDVQQEERRAGRNVPMNAVVGIALPRWRSLPDNEKQRYERIARSEKQRSRGVPAQTSNPNRLDNQGQLISNRKDPHEEGEKRRQRESKFLLSRWSSLPDITQEKFYLISFEYLCQIEENDQYLPLEVAIVEFSMATGIASKYFHSFIYPGDDTHQIPIEGFDQASDEYASLWNRMENFVNRGGEKQEYPPLFCMEQDMACVESCMQWLHERACMGYSNRLSKIFFLENMIMELYIQAKNWVSITQIIEMLDTSAYDYEAQTRCPYHEEKEVKHCAVGNCKRKIYALLQSLAVIHNFDLTPSHLPVQPTHQPAVKMIPPPSDNSTNQYSAWGRGRGQRQERGGAKPVGGRGYSHSSSDVYTARDVRYQNSEGSTGDSDENGDSDFADTVSEQSTVALETAPRPPGPWNTSSKQTQPWNNTSQKSTAASDASDNTWPSLSESKPKFSGRAGPPAPAELPPPSKWTGEQVGASRQPRTAPQVLRGMTPRFTAIEAASVNKGLQNLSLQEPAAQQQRSFGRGMAPPVMIAPGVAAPGVTQPGSVQRPAGRGRGVWHSPQSLVNDDCQSTVSMSSQSSTVSWAGRGYMPGAVRPPPGF